MGNTITNTGISQGQIYEMLSEIVTQVNALTADNVAYRAAIVAITAQLDADTGVTDTDYAANNDPAAATATTTLSLTTAAD